MNIRIYYADTDAQGIVYHANYLRFFEAARTEYLRALGLELPTMYAEYGVQFAVVEITLKYHKPARLDDQLILVSRISHIGRASVNYEQEIYLFENNISELTVASEFGMKSLVCRAEVRLATIDKQMRPQAVPDVIKRGVINDH